MNDPTTQPGSTSLTAHAGQGDAALIAGQVQLVKYRPWLHRFAIALVIGTFILIIMGGNVTSRGAGLAVPDGFTVYGYFLWSFPIEKWVGNILHEHVHRLMGSLVGLMCIIAVLLAWTPRWDMKWPLRFAGPRLEKFVPDPSLDRPAVRWFSLVVLMLIIIQGVLGALRVSEISTPLAVIHGVHAQIFLCLTVLFAVMTSPLWINVANRQLETKARNSEATPACECAWSRMSLQRKLSVVALLVVLAQIIIGADMRHAGAGLAIPDFPTNLGSVVPALDEQGIADYYHANPTDDDHAHLPTPWMVGIHFAHRVGAIFVVLAIVAMIAAAAKNLGQYRQITVPSLALIVLLITQVALGVAIIFWLRPPNIATAHQALGAATFATTFLLAVRIALLERLARLSPASVDASDRPQSSRAQDIAPVTAPLSMENAKA